MKISFTQFFNCYFAYRWNTIGRLIEMLNVLVPGNFPFYFDEIQDISPIIQVGGLRSFHFKERASLYFSINLASLSILLLSMMLFLGFLFLF